MQARPAGGLPDRRHRLPDRGGCVFGGRYDFGGRRRSTVYNKPSGRIGDGDPAFFRSEALPGPREKDGSGRIAAADLAIRPGVLWEKDRIRRFLMANGLANKSINRYNNIDYLFIFC